MLYITTGANGSGKTLLTLKDVREQQLKENRPVYYHGFEALQPIKDFGWIYWEDPKKWMEIPEGSICLFDECQVYFGKGREVPSYILDLAKYRRKRGIDMWLITPHPTMLHVDVRRLVESPSWHRHVKRTVGAQLANVITFPGGCDLKCDEPGSGERGQIEMRPYPKDVYTWYSSTSLNTAKVKIPKRIYLVAAIAVAVPALMYAAFTTLRSNVLKNTDPEKTPVVQTASIQPGSAAPGRNSPALDYFDSRTPRVAGLPHTAPVYDTLTAPRRAPIPAACIASRTRCECYTQDGTRLATPDEICRQVVDRGIFVDWETTSSAVQQSGDPDRPPVGRP